MKSNVLLSILTCNYNYGHYLKEASKIILQYLPHDCEHIILDDGSTDDSWKIIQEIKKAHSGIRIYQNDRNRGIEYSLGRLRTLAQGKYVLAMSADDYILPAFFDKAIPLLRQYDCGILTSPFTVCPADFTLAESLFDTIKTYNHLPQKTYFFSHKDITPALRSLKLWLPGSHSIIKRELLEKYGGYRKDLAIYCDWYLNHLVCLDGGCIYIPDVIALFRRHENSASRKISQQERKGLIKKLCYAYLSESKNTRKRMRQAAIFSDYFVQAPILFLVNPWLWPLLPSIARRWLIRLIRREIIRKTHPKWLNRLELTTSNHPGC